MSDKMRVLFTALTLAMVAFVAACGGDAGQVATSPIPESTPLATIEPTPEPSPEPTPMPFTAPLTGVGLEQEAGERPIAVLVNNFAAARPQSGLTNADVIWEVLAEGGITRLVAVYQSTEQLTDTVGPIRSNRAYFIDIADSYGAIVAHAGGSPEAYGILKKQGKHYLDEITNAGSSFWRSKDRKAPHNLYSDLEKLRAAAEKKKYTFEGKIPGYSFAEEGVLGGADGATAESVTELAITFLLQSYKVGYIYDAESGLYKRSINSEPHIDLNNNEQLTAANLIVFETGHKTLDNVGRLAVDLTAGGSAYLFQKGKKLDIEWLKSSDGMIRFIKNGVEVPLVPGKTYIHIVPNKPALPEHVVWEGKAEEGANG